MNHIAVDIGPTFNSPIGQSIFVADLISIILSNAVFIAGALLVVLFVFGGAMMIIGAGSGNSETVGQGKKAATYAVVGFVIIFTAYWIVQALEILTGMEILNPGL